MSSDVHTGKLKKNAFRVAKQRNIGASRVRVPGGCLDAKVLGQIQKIAETYGDGKVHLTSRQGFEITGIHFDDMDKVNDLLQPIIEAHDINQDGPGQGYPASGTRNISACIGERVCHFGCYDTTALAQRIEKAIFPHDLHFKIGVTGCSNDCGKVRLNDFGIMGMTEPQLDESRCVSCGACEKYCAARSVGAIELVNGKPVRNAEKCIGCGVCIVYCPMRAWTRSTDLYYRLTVFGRTGKQNPRMGETWLEWVDEDAIIQIIQNTYPFVDRYIDENAPGRKEHVGYIVDRMGFNVFRRWALRGITLPEKTVEYSPLYWTGIQNEPQTSDRALRY